MSLTLKKIIQICKEVVQLCKINFVVVVVVQLGASRENLAIN